jgi:cytoskeletal protein CcmA (bactofilin family)
MNRFLPRMIFAALLTVAAGTASAADGTTVRIGGTIDIRDDMNGQLIAVAGATNIEGRIDGGAVIAAGRINIAGTVQDDVLAASGAFTLWPQAQIGGDLRLASGDAEVAGAVGGDLVVMAGSVVVAGQIGGDLRTMAGKVIVLPGAVIGGRIITHGPGLVDVSRDAQVLGGVAPSEPQQTKRNRENRGGSHALITGTLLFTFLRLPVIGLGTLITGLLFLAIFPSFAEAAAGTLRAQPGASVLTGFVTFAAVPLAILVLMLTILGLPVAVLAAAAFLLILVVAYGFGALTLICAIWRRMRSVNERSLALPTGFWRRALCLFIALAVLSLLRPLPIAGDIAFWGTLMLGLGGLTLEVWRRWHGHAA